MKRFKLVRVMMGSGWPSGHIAIDQHIKYPGKPGGGEMCLTMDAQDAAELSIEIDGLISELEAIRSSATEKFSDWQRQYKASLGK